MPRTKDGQNDGQPIGAEDGADLVTLSREDYDRLLSAGTDSGVNPAPAIEEGPHLDDPDLRRAKRDQMRAAGLDHESEGISDHMRDILREGDE